MCFVPGAWCFVRRGARKALVLLGFGEGQEVQTALKNIFFVRPSHTPARHLARRCEVLAARGGAPHTPRPRTVGDGIAHSAIGASGIAAGLEGCAFSSRRRHSRHPAPGGVAPSPTSRKRAFRATRKLGKPHVDARKGVRVLLEHSITTHGKSMETFGRHSNEQTRGQGSAARGDAVFKLY